MVDVLRGRRRGQRRRRGVRRAGHRTTCPGGGPDLRRVGPGRRRRGRAARRPRAWAAARWSACCCRARSTTWSATRPPSGWARSPRGSTSASGAAEVDLDPRADPTGGDRRRRRRRPPRPDRPGRCSSRSEVPVPPAGRPPDPVADAGARPTRWPWCGRAGRPACPRARCSTTTAWPRWPPAPTCCREPGDRRLSPLPFAHVGSMTRVWDEIGQRGDHGDHPHPVAGGRRHRRHGGRADHRGPGRSHPVGAGAGPPGAGRGRPVVPADRRHRRVPGAARAGGGHARALRGARWWCATRRPRRRSAPAPCPATPTRWWPPRSAGRCPGSSCAVVDDDGARGGRRRGRPGPAPVGGGDARLLGRAADRSGCRRAWSTTGTATRAGAGRRRLADHRRLRLRWTTTGACTWSGGPTSSTSGAATTSTRPRSRRVLGRPSGRRAGGGGRRARPGARGDRGGLRRARRAAGAPDPEARCSADLRADGPGLAGRLQGARPGGGGRRPPPDLDDEGRQEGPGRAGGRPAPCAGGKPSLERARHRGLPRPTTRRTEREHS